MIIRQEKETDYSKIYSLIQTAFETAEQKDGTEQELVNELRTGDRYIPELALVAESSNNIVGYIMFTKTYIHENTESFEALLIAPLAVALPYRDQKIGSQLIYTGMKIARELGYKAVFLAGNPSYYHRFGFVPTIEHNIKFSPSIPIKLYKNIMVYELIPNSLQDISGVVEILHE